MLKNYHLAFVTDAGQCQPAWGGQSSYRVDEAWGKPLTDKLKNQGVHFYIALGGANGSDLSMACSQDQLSQKLMQIVSTYEPEGLDFDIENGTANVTKLMPAIRKVQTQVKNLPVSFTLPVMPEGLTEQGKEIVRQAKMNDLRFTVNIMAMDYGAAYTGDMAEYAIQAATNLAQFLQSLYPRKKTTRNLAVN